MKIFTSDNADPNYLASVVEVGEVRPHTNPKTTKLKLITIFGNQVTVGLDTKEGDRVIYFPVESCIAAVYLSWANQYRTATLNKDPSVTGYFDDNRRVKALRLQGEVSQGIIIPVEKIAEFFGIDPALFKTGLNFDTVGDTVLVEKYIPRSSHVQGEAREKSNKEKDPGVSKLLKANQFRFHGKTTNLGMAAHLIKPSSLISISTKAHGTSAVFGKLLCTRPLGWKEKVAKFFGVAVKEEEYKFIYSSRTVLKNRRDGSWTDDVWGLHAQQLEAKIPEGFTVYGEIVGYTPSGRGIQKAYDYGCEAAVSEFWAYRVTHTDRSGEVLEFDWQQINDFCHARNIKTVPTYFYGMARDLFDIDNENPKWNEKFLEELRETYLDKDCELCKNKLVREGICLRVESSSHKSAWKFKSPLFVLGESASRDKGEINMEEEN